MGRVLAQLWSAPFKIPHRRLSRVTVPNASGVSAERDKMGGWTWSVGHVLDLLRAPVDWTRRRFATKPPSVRGRLAPERELRPRLVGDDSGHREGRMHEIRTALRIAK